MYVYQWESNHSVSIPMPYKLDYPFLFSSINSNLSFFFEVKNSLRTVWTENWTNKLCIRSIEQYLTTKNRYSVLYAKFSLFYRSVTAYMDELAFLWNKS